METLTIKIKKKNNVSVIKKILNALDVEIIEKSEPKEITNPEILKMLKDIEENKNNPEYFEKNFKTVNPDNIWESIL
ncbi:MAG: hypothetical protein QM564_03600 [Bergeyella sp.]